jgi:osmoprotectant transport system ATP-binding protein
VIEFRSVCKSFRSPEGAEVVAVRELSLVVEPGETLCLIGTSGCGKTTTMKMVNRLLEPTRGQVLVDGIDVMQQDLIALRRRIGYVVQARGVFPHMTVAENVGLLCQVEGWDRERTRERVEELLAMVNLPPGAFAGRYPGELSGGQRQRVGVARALALDPATVLMDEPFGALDPITRDAIHEEFLALKRRVRKTTILVTHDMAEAFRLGDRVALMDAGKLLQVGTREDFRARPASAFVSEFLESHLHGGRPDG